MPGAAISQRVFERPLIRLRGIEEHELPAQSRRRVARHRHHIVRDAQKTLVHHPRHACGVQRAEPCGRMAGVDQPHHLDVPRQRALRPGLQFVVQDCILDCPDRPLPARGIGGQQNLVIPPALIPRQIRRLRPVAREIEDQRIAGLRGRCGGFQRRQNLAAHRLTRGHVGRQTQGIRGQHHHLRHTPPRQDLGHQPHVMGRPVQVGIQHQIVRDPHQNRPNVGQGRGGEGDKEQGHKPAHDARRISPDRTGTSTQIGVTTFVTRKGSCLALRRLVAGLRQGRARLLPRWPGRPSCTGKRPLGLGEAGPRPATARPGPQGEGSR